MQKKILHRWRRSL